MWNNESHNMHKTRLTHTTFYNASIIGEIIDGTQTLLHTNVSLFANDLFDSEDKPYP